LRGPVDEVCAIADPRVTCLKKAWKLRGGGSEIVGGAQTLGWWLVEVHEAASARERSRL